MSDERRERFLRLERHFLELEALDSEARAAALGRLERSEPDLFPELHDLLNIGGTEIVADLGARSRESLAPDRTDSGAELAEGRYRLLRPIGEGGMGRVWEAEQTAPVKRKVAIKVLSGHGEGRAATGRFEAERQALATMEHPHIAQVFDAGTSDDGSPFFAMELVEGAEPITRYCRRRDLGLEQSLRLFLQVCDAVEHAHRKRVIHRDLKPSNVLVSDATGKPVVKVIDFGIAKPLEEQLLGEAGATRVGELVGTPEYMSPEQASLGAIDIDTRSDVYTLGLLLFELVVGERPLDSRSLRQLPFDEWCRRIREDELPRPSAVLRRTTQAGTASTGWTWRRVQGDLDRIVGKAVAKDREQRYGSASDLAEDIERMLRHEPVHAMPPSTGYRFAKFVRRNRVPVAATTFLMLGLILGLTVALVAFRRARAAEAEARANLANLESSEQFLIDLFEGASPDESLGDDPPASELLARGIERLENLDERPRV